MIRRIVTGAAAVLCVALSAAHSQAAITWDLKPSGTGNWDWRLRGLYTWYDDGGQDFPETWLYGILWAKAEAHCIEVSTGPGRFASNPDTRIWVRTQAGQWLSVNDDFGGTVQSKARIWVAYPGADTDGQFYTKVAPYNATGKYDDFELIITRRDLSETQCTTGQTTIPWAKFSGTGEFQYTLTRSPNAT